MIIEIINWEKYNPRKDIKASTWMRVQNSLFENHEFFDLTHSEICFWLYLMSIASKKQSGTVILVRSHAIAIGRFTDKVIDSSIQKLININCVSIRNAHVTDSKQGGTLPDLTGPDLTGPDLTGTDTLALDKSTAVASHHSVEFDQVLAVFGSRGIKPNLSSSWLIAFPEPDWIIQEINKAISWENANPRSRKKNFGRFVTNWLTRGWDSRKLQTTRLTTNQQHSMNNAAMMEKIKKGEL